MDGIAERITFLHCYDCFTEWDETKRQPVNAWIDCSERLPEPYDDVLINDGSKYVILCHLDEDNNWRLGYECENDGDADIISHVTHWQPLPQPPVAGKDGE